MPHSEIQTVSWTALRENSLIMNLSLRNIWYFLLPYRWEESAVCCRWCYIMRVRKAENAFSLKATEKKKTCAIKLTVMGMHVYCALSVFSIEPTRCWRRWLQRWSSRPSTVPCGAAFWPARLCVSPGWPSSCCTSIASSPWRTSSMSLAVTSSSWYTSHKHALSKYLVTKYCVTDLCDPRLKVKLGSTPPSSKVVVLCSGCFSALLHFVQKQIWRRRFDIQTLI